MPKTLPSKINAKRDGNTCNLDGRVSELVVYKKYTTG